MTLLSRKKHRITRPNISQATALSPPCRHAAMVRAGRLFVLFTFVLLGSPYAPTSTAGELNWESPNKSERVVQSKGVWTQRGQGGRIMSSERFERLDRTGVRQVAHYEPATLGAPRFAAMSTEAEDNSLRSLRSVVVRRSEGYSTDSPRLAAQPADGWRMNGPSHRSSRMRTVAANQIQGGQIVDPFEEDFPEPETVDAPSTDRTNTLRDAQENQGATPAEPKPFGVAPNNDNADGATARDLFPEAADSLPSGNVDVDNRAPAEPVTPVQPTQPAKPMETEDAGEFEFKPTYIDEYDVDEDQQQSQEVCDKQLGRLKLHTLHPWRDTQKEGWEQRDDEIRDLLDIRVAGAAGADYPFECGLGNDPYTPRTWSEITYMWKSAALCHKPLYFENVSLERYGHSWGPYAQPIISGAHFFVTVPFLPYKMGIRTPNECVYTLGYYRPGNCAPYLIDPIPVTWRAILFEAGVITGVSAIVP